MDEKARDLISSLEIRLEIAERKIEGMRKIQNDILYVLGKTFIK